MSLCPESEERAALSDGEFWDRVLQPSQRPGADWDPVDLDGPLEQADTRCPECGEYGACGYDTEGRAMIHVTESTDA